jgi:galactoside O-acetyltransferase
MGFARLGDGVLIHRTATIVDFGKLSLGSRVRIDPYVIISNEGGVEFGNNIHMGGHTVMAGQAAIRFEDFVNVSHFIGIFTSSDDFSGRTLNNPTIPAKYKFPPTAPIAFGRHAGVGAGSFVLAGARFAEGSVIAASNR